MKSDEEMTRLDPLVWRLEKSWQNCDLQDAEFFVAASGGRDSAVLMDMMGMLQKKHSFKMFFCYIHHGLGAEDQEKYRFEALQFVRKKAKAWNVPFLSNFVSSNLKGHDLLRAENLKWPFPVQMKTELEMREYRHYCLRQMTLQSSKAFVVTGHHWQDLLETRLHRLIRGTGWEGMSAMSEAESLFWRPLLMLKEDELKNYANRRELTWVEDPSNQSLEPFRNWLRHKWLGDLEERQEGACERLAKSLELLAQDRLAQDGDPTDLSEFFFEDAILVRNFLELKDVDKRRVLVSYMKRKKMKDYGQSHVLEVLKRLDTTQKRHTFRLLKHEWVVTPEKIQAKPDDRG